MHVTPRAWAWVAGIGALIAVAGAGLGWGAFPAVVNVVIGKQLALKEGSEAWDRFVDLPLELDMKLSIFNVTNTDEIMTGAKPKLQEVGPYVYKQHRRKEKLEVDTDDDTVSYYQKLIHTFDPEQSGKFREDDVVTVIHPALLSMLSIMQNIPVLSKGTMFVDAAAPLLFPEGLFLTTTADKLLFRGVRIPCGKVENAEQGAPASAHAAHAARGGATPHFAPHPRLAALITCSSLKRIKVPTISVLDDGDVLFSLFGYKNDTYDGRYTVQAGIKRPEDLAKITAWNGKPQVTAWGGPTCNTVNGTQGDIFSPYINTDTVLSVFSTDICRSMAIRYVGESSYRGISGYRFAPGPETMAAADENGDNYCFCPQVAKGLTKENGCLRKGAMDLSGCQGIPVIITYPHFYEADPFYLDGVEGLNPQQELHRMQLDIEPMSGTPLYGGKKMQLNFELKQVEGVKLTGSVRSTLFPVAWMYEGAALNDQLVDLLNGMLITNLKILTGIKYAMLALGAAMFLVGTFMYFRTRRRPSVKPQSPKGVEAQQEAKQAKRPSGDKRDVRLNGSEAAASRAILTAETAETAETNLHGQSSGQDADGDAATTQHTQHSS